MKRIILFLFIAVSLISSFAAAEEKEKEDVRVLEEVVVKSTKIDNLFLPLNASVVSEEDLQSRLPVTSDSASLLNGIPGVSLIGAGGLSSLPSIHGLADDRLRIKVDGMDLVASCPNHMNPPLSYVDPSNVGSIKVFAGITPVSVGGDSIGGTIIIETPEPVFAAPGQHLFFQGEAGFFYRSNGNGFGGSLSTTVASEKFSMTYSGATAKSDNYNSGSDFKTTTATGRDGHTLPLDEVGSTAYKTWNHTLGFAMKGSNQLFEAKLGYQDMPYQLYPNQRMDMLENTEHRLNLRNLGHYGWGTLEMRAYHETVDHFMDFGEDKRFWYGTNSGSGAVGYPCSPIRFSGDPAGTCAAGMPMYTESKTTGASVKADINISAQDILRVGSEVQFYRLDDWWPASGGGMGPGTFWNIKDGERDRAALFGEWEARINPKWMTLFGIRYEHLKTDTGDVAGYSSSSTGNQARDANNFNALNHSKTDNNWDMTALARYTADTALDFEFGLAHKTRSPNLYERYAWSTWSMAATMVNWAGDGNGYIGNIDLRPEKANTVSVTIDWHADDRRWEFKATPYYTRVTDYIDVIQWNSTTNTPATTLATNQFTVLKFVNQSARLYGLDLSGKMPLARTGFGELGLKGLLNYTNGKNLDIDDGLYNIMPLNANITLTHKHGGWNNGIEVIMVKGKDDVSDMRNEIKTPGYNLVNLRAGHSWKKVRVDFGIENLFDKLYYLPLGGAYTGQGRTMALNPTDGTMSWGTAVPGPGRSFYAGMSIKF